MGRTLIIIKPDAVKKNKIGAIISEFESKGYKVVGMRMVQLTREQAKKFYIMHKDKHFYEDVSEFMSSCPVVVVSLEGDDHIDGVRNLMGETDSKKAAPGTIRYKFGTDIQANAVHGSDSQDSADRELSFSLMSWKFSIINV